VAAAPASSSSPGVTPAKNADRHRFVGIEDQANTLAERLKKKIWGGETGTGEGKLNAVFSVVGFGGLGKTTLAMEVCRIVEADFPFQAMVAVSQAFEPTRDLKPLLKRLLQQVLTCRADNEKQALTCRADNEKGVKLEQGALGGDIVDGLDVNQLATKMEEGLNGKRYAQLSRMTVG
jgi:disease resistance protein RPM1